MNKPSKFALAFAFAALTATGVASAQTVDNWKNGSNELIWKNGTNELCWQDNFWTPATAAAECVKKSGQPMSDKISIKAEALFDFDKAIVKPEGRKLLDQVADRAAEDEPGRRRRRRPAVDLNHHRIGLAGDEIAGLKHPALNLLSL